MMADPRKLEDDLYGAGAKTRRGLGEAFDQSKRVAGNVALQATKPFLAPAAMAVPFAQGLAGAQRPQAAAPAAAPPANPGRPAATAPAGVNFNRPAPRLRGVVSTGPVTRIEDAARPGDLNTFTFDGRTQRVEPAAVATAAASPQPTLRALTPAVATRSTQPVARDATQRAAQGQRSAALDVRADAASVLNPMSQGAELMRRLDNVSISSQFKGSPGARSDARQAILGQLDAQNRASAEGQQGINATLRQGAGGEMDAAEAFAARRDEADRFNISTDLDARALQQRGQSPADVVRGADGRVSVLRNDGSAYTLRNEEGEPVIGQAEGRRFDVVSADTQYNALADQLAALQASGRPVGEKMAAESAAYDQQVGAIQARMDALAGGAPAAAVPPYASFVQAIKARNPGATDEQIRDFYATEYPGAIAQ